MGERDADGMAAVDEPASVGARLRIRVGHGEVQRRTRELGRERDGLVALDVEAVAGHERLAARMRVEVPVGHGDVERRVGHGARRLDGRACGQERAAQVGGDQLPARRRSWWRAA